MTNKVSYRTPTVLLLAVGAALVWLTFNYFIEFSGFAMIVAKAAIGLSLAAIVDNVILGGLNTHDEISGGNTAYAVVYLGFMLIIAAAIVAS